MKLKSPKIETNQDDEFLYVQLLKLLEQIKLTQGGTNLDATLRNHKNLKIYLISKQIEKIRHIEEKYFNEDGTLNSFSIQDYHQKSSLQNNN